MSQVFKQCGSDLIALINLELVESLCGFRKAIQTPNNGDVVITTKPGVVTHHGEKKNMLKEGPTCKNPLKKDRLVIQFLVNFPCSVDHGVIPALEYYLPLRPSVFLPDFFERCHLKNLDAEHEKRVWRAYLGPAYDEDDDHPIINLYKNEQGDFKQSGNDLIICLTIELVEALCGFRKVIETVDNRYITFEVMPGRVTKPGKMKYVSNQGVYYGIRKVEVLLSHKISHKGWLVLVGGID